MNKQLLIAATLFSATCSMNSFAFTQPNNTLFEMELSQELITANQSAVMNSFMMDHSFVTEQEITDVISGEIIYESVADLDYLYTY